MHLLRSHLLALVVLVGFTVPQLASAQMSFEGLDLGKKKKKKKKTSSGSAKEKDEDEEEKEKEKKADAPPPVPEGGVDLTKPATATADEKKDNKPAPTMSFETMDISGKTADRQKLEVAVSHFKSEAYEQASLTAYDLMQDPKMAGLHLEAHYLLAKSLYRMGLYHSALGEFSKILAKGPSTKFFKTSLEWLFFISHKTTNETVILDEIAKYANFEFPEKFRNEFRYLLARYHLMRGKALDEIQQKGEADKSFDEVRRLVLMIPKGDPFYPRAKYLEGVAYFRDNKFEAAVEAMKEVIRNTRMSPGPMTPERKQMQHVRELAFMQLARTHYGHKQFRYSIHYFSKIDRGTPQWLESLFEASWASYQIVQHEQALGNLITLSSPFFRDEYFPEALILKAVIYYQNCRYKEALTIIEDFERIYGPVHEELKLLVGKKMDSSEYYNVLAEVQRKNKEGLEKNGTDLILERILKLALTDKDLKRTNDSILELEAEIDQMGTKSDAFKYSNLTKALIESLKVQREELIKKAGIMAQGKLEFETDELGRLRGDALRIRIETVAKEKDYLEEQLKAEGKKEIVRKYNYSVAVADDQLYWPFVGEYWRDELGTYHYTLTKGCIEKENLTTASAGGP